MGKSELRYGDWKILSAPEFPNKIENDENECRYTLGRLSFNMFEPKNTVCTLHGGRDSKTRLPATMRIEGTCFPKTDNRTSVVFTSGELFEGKEITNDPVLRKAWNETFEKAYEEGQKNAGYLSWVFMGLFSYVVDLHMPTDE